MIGVIWGKWGGRGDMGRLANHITNFSAICPPVSEMWNWGTSVSADYDSLSANYRHLYGFHYERCLPLQAIYRQGWSISLSLPLVVKNYQLVGNVVMKSCTSGLDHLGTRSGDASSYFNEGEVEIN